MLSWLVKTWKPSVSRFKATPQTTGDPGNVPWAAFHALIHETRCPLTVVAYASEILLDASRPFTRRSLRQHVESIHRACHEASSYVTLLSRCIEVEQAGQSPSPEPFPVEAFRDPEGQAAGPAIQHDAVAYMDLRLAGNLAVTLWELASLLPGTRPALSAVGLDSRHLRLRIRAPGTLGTVLTEPAQPEPRHGRGATSTPDPFPVVFRARLLRRCLALLGGTVERTHAGADDGDIHLRIPVHPPVPTAVKKPSKTH
jgi:hypothetical protein